MKFGKYLQVKMVAEWRGAYVSYRRLKRIIKRLPSTGADSRASSFSGDFSLQSAVVDVDSHATPAPDDGLGLGIPLLSVGVRRHTTDESNLFDEVTVAFLSLLNEDIGRLNAHVAKHMKKMGDLLALLTERAEIEGRASDQSIDAAAAAYRSTPSSLGSSSDFELAYLGCLRLRGFISLNHTAVRKIVKKFDKHSARAPKTPEILLQLAREPFYGEDRLRLEAMIASLEGLCAPHVVLKLRVKARSHEKPADSWRVPLLLGSLAAGLLALFLPLFSEEHAQEQRCFAMVLTVVMLWLTESLPFFVTSLCVPLLATVGHVVPPKPGELHPEVARRVLNSMFDHVILLVLGGLVAATVVARSELELRVASLMQRQLGNRPLAFQLAMMELGLVFSCCVSNVTAPILLLSVVQPVLRELPSGSSYSRAMLVGIAFACNLGGMLTPIASPQNAVALEALQRIGVEISFGAWLRLALPLAQLSLLLIWLLLLVLLRPTDCERLPAIAYKPTKMGNTPLAMLIAVGVTVVLLGSLSAPPLSETLGDPAMAALLLVVVTFGSGFLSKDDFNGLSWHLLSLIAGGNALGLAVKESGLLQLFASKLTSGDLLSHSPWGLTAQLVLVVFVTSSFVSHTVASIVLMPLIASIGEHVGIAERLVFLSAMACSASMALPMSSFPNVSALLAEDDHGLPYLKPKDFLRPGLPASLTVIVLVVTVGYSMAYFDGALNES